MSDYRITELIEELSAVGEGGTLDIRGYRDRIVSLHQDVVEESDRELLIQTFFLLLGQAERSAVTQGVDPQSLRNLRDADHRMMLLSEAMIGDHVDPKKLAEVTSREVAARRLEPDDSFHTLALAGRQVLGTSDRGKEPKSFWGRIFGGN